MKFETGDIVQLEPNHEDTVQKFFFQGDLIVTGTANETNGDYQLIFFDSMDGSTSNHINSKYLVLIESGRIRKLKEIINEINC